MLDADSNSSEDQDSDDTGHVYSETSSQVTTFSQFLGKRKE